MKTLISIIAAGLVAASASAQQSVKINYDAVTRSSSSDSLTTKAMTLIADGSGSLYFNEMSQYVDSVCSTPEGRKQLKQIQMAAWISYGSDGSITINKSKGNVPDKQIYTYVAKNNDKGEMTVYDRWSRELFYYTEPAAEMQWSEVADSTENILGYECFMAETDYHGRHWKAWFTPEIPVQDGPWKFHGLPGMILKADSGDGFSFTATAIETKTQAVPEVYRKDKYSKGERRQLLSDHEHYANNITSIMASEGVTFKNPQELPKFDRSRHAIESDY